jgi:hypothetical protein
MYQCESERERRFNTLNSMCVYEREREKVQSIYSMLCVLKTGREIIYVCVCVRACACMSIRDRCTAKPCVCAGEKREIKCVWVRERERVCVFDQKERNEKKRETGTVCRGIKKKIKEKKYSRFCVSVCICVCVCVF